MPLVCNLEDEQSRFANKKEQERRCPSPEAKTEPVVIRTSRSEQELAILKGTEQLLFRVAPTYKHHNGKPLGTQNKTAM